MQRCRKESNAKHTPEEASEMESDLEKSGRTLNLPFCFTEGAMQLKQSLMREAYNSTSSKARNARACVCLCACMCVFSTAVCLCTATRVCVCDARAANTE